MLQQPGTAASLEEGEEGELRSVVDVASLSHFDEYQALQHQMVLLAAQWGS